MEKYTRIPTKPAEAGAMLNAVSFGFLLRDQRSDALLDAGERLLILSNVTADIHRDEKSQSLRRQLMIEEEWRV